MADTEIATGHALAYKQQNDRAFIEYVDKLILAPFMGTSSEHVIVVVEDLMKKKGDAVTIPLSEALDGSAVTGEGAMEGNEEAMVFYGHTMNLEQYKNAVVLNGSMTERRTAFEIRDLARPALTTWKAQLVEDQMFAAFASIDGTVYASATEGNKDTWTANNSDRVLFGAATANNSGNDHSASLSNVDSTNDIMSTDIISLGKRLAELANPKIRPIKIEGGEEWYVLFMHPYAARDLKNGSAWQQAQREAQMRAGSNPIFTGALGAWDGVILKESPKSLLLSGVGASSIDVAQNYLCGAQALGMAQGGYSDGSKVVLTEKLFDYDEKYGVQIKSTFAAEKLVFNNKQHGVVTVYTAGVAD